MPGALHEVQEERAKLVALLEAASRVMLDRLLPTAAKSVAAQAERARLFRFHIAVVGEFSAGKSTLLNALLGQKLLPAKMPPCTAAPIAIRYAERPGIVVKFKDGREEPRPFEDLPRLVELKVDEEEEAARALLESQVETVFVEVPTQLCADNVVLHDTPGLNESTIRSALTLGMLSEMDAVVFVTRCTQLFTTSERDFLRSEHARGALQRRWLDRVFVVASYADALADSDAPEKERAELRGRCDSFLDRELGGLARGRRFLVDAQSALAARTGRKARTDGEEFTQFEAALFEFLVRDRAREGWMSQKAAALAAIDSSMNLLKQETTALETEAAELRHRAAQARARIEDARARAKRIMQRFRQRGDDFTRNLVNEFRVASAEWCARGVVDHLMSVEYPDSVLRPKKAAEWYGQQASTWVEEAVRAWSEDVPKQRLEKLLADFEQENGDELRQFRDDLKDIVDTLHIDSSLPAPEDDESLMQWIFRSGAGFLAGGPLGVVIAHTIGWRGVVTNLIANFALGFALAALGFSIPVIGQIALAAAIALAQIGLGQSGIKARIRDKVIESMRRDLPAAMSKAADTIRESATHGFGQIAEQLEASMTALVTMLHDAERATAHDAELDANGRERQRVELGAAIEDLGRIRGQIEAVGDGR